MLLNNSRRVIAIFLLLLTSPLHISARGAQEGKPPVTNPYAEAISTGKHAIKEMMIKYSVPGVGVAVAIDGKIVWSEGFGFADLEQEVPVTRETKFGIGSISKSLTMALFARLMEEGCVNLDVPVEFYLEDFPHKNLKITTRLIAGHLSGLDDSFNTANVYNTTHYSSTSEALGQIFKEPLRSRPGESHFYTTGPYTIIAGVIEKVVQKDFLSAMGQYVIKPLGLRNTLPNDRKAIISNRTSFYIRESDKTIYARYFDPSFKWAGAGYLSTADDMANFGSTFLRPGFFKQTTIDELFRPLKTSAGDETGFGLGWRIAVDKKKRYTVYQPGGGPGISSQLSLYPRDGLVVAILSNQTGTPVGDTILETIVNSFVRQRDKSSARSSSLSKNSAKAYLN